MLFLLQYVKYWTAHYAVDPYSDILREEILSECSMPMSVLLSGRPSFTPSVPVASCLIARWPDGFKGPSLPITFELS